MTKVKCWAVPLLLVVVLLLVCGCASAPRAWEQKFFDIQTSTLPRVVVVIRLDGVWRHTEGTRCFRMRIIMGM